MRKALVCFLLLTSITVSIMFTGFKLEKNEFVDLPIIMYHNVLPDKYNPNKYEIRVSDLEQDFKYIKDNGYTPISLEMLVAYTEKKIKLPEKPIILTFDDGFYNYNLLLLPLLEKFDFHCVISVVGKFTEYNKKTNASRRYTYMDYEDMAEMAKSGKANIECHTFNLHSLKNRKGVAMKKGENVVDYRKLINSDCEKLETELKKINIKPICYTYPYGAYSNEAEKVIKERGYKMSLTCEEKTNKITRSPDCLYLLGRFNRDGMGGSVEKILNKA